MSGRSSESPGGSQPFRRKRDSTGHRADPDPVEVAKVDRSVPEVNSARPTKSEPVWSEEFDSEDENWVEPAAAAPQDRAVLDEIARIQGDLAAHPPGGDPRSSPSGNRVGGSGRDENGRAADRELWGEPSPYLEERLTVARSAAERLAGQAERVSRTVSDLKGDLETIHRELDRAADELGFLRSEGATEREIPEPPEFRGPGGAAYGGVVAMSVAAASPDLLPSSPASTYSSFTVSRYNDTVQALHDRRRSLAWGTVVLAAGISALLLVLTLRAHEPLPSMWLAVLPLVWMIPVPFFVAAFLGTQRILKKNRLDLKEAT